jgi:hypothetical protein
MVAPCAHHPWSPIILWQVRDVSKDLDTGLNRIMNHLTSHAPAKVPSAASRRMSRILEQGVVPSRMSSREQSSREASSRDQSRMPSQMSSRHSSFSGRQYAMPMAMAPSSSSPLASSSAGSGGGGSGGGGSGGGGGSSAPAPAVATAPRASERASVRTSVAEAAPAEESISEGASLVEQQLAANLSTDAKKVRERNHKLQEMMDARMVEVLVEVPAPDGTIIYKAAYPKGSEWRYLTNLAGREFDVQLSSPSLSVSARSAPRITHTAQHPRGDPWPVPTERVCTVPCRFGCVEAMYQGLKFNLPLEFAVTGALGGEKGEKGEKAIESVEEDFPDYDPSKGFASKQRRREKEVPDYDRTSPSLFRVLAVPGPSFGCSPSLVPRSLRRALPRGLSR